MQRKTRLLDKTSVSEGMEVDDNWLISEETFVTSNQSSLVSNDQLFPR